MSKAEVWRLTGRDRLSGSFPWFSTGRHMENTPSSDLRPSTEEYNLAKFCSVVMIAG